MSFIAPSASPSTADERRTRVQAVAARLRAEGLSALLLGPTASLLHFTGLDWHPSERLTGLGHGIGLDIHEAPNLVRGDRTALQAGMCFSNEPMLVIPGQLDVRLEDHFHMSEAGPVWFTQPSHSLDDPFGKGASA